MIRTTFGNAFRSDPLRLLRGATALPPSSASGSRRSTTALIRRQKELISRVAAERVAHELDLIMGSGLA